MSIFVHTPYIGLPKGWLNIHTLEKIKSFCHNEARDLELCSSIVGHNFGTIKKETNEDIILLLKVFKCDIHDSMKLVGNEKARVSPYSPALPL